MRERLTTEQVEEICKLLEQGYRNSEVANMLSVDQEKVINIHYGRTHKKISSKYNLKKIRKDRIEESRVELICYMIKSGFRNSTICQIFNIDRSIISQIRCGKIYTKISSKYGIKPIQQSKSAVIVRFTDEEVHQICELIQDGYSNSYISKKFNVDRTRISNIRCGRSYKHITKSYNLYINKLKESVVREICKMIDEGYKYKEISEKFNIAMPTISNIRTGRIHRNITKDYNFMK